MSCKDQVIFGLRFESPISISKWNNRLEFRRKSKNYYKVKVFSDSWPKSAQKLNLKVCQLSRCSKIFVLTRMIHGYQEFFYGILLELQTDLIEILEYSKSIFSHVILWNLVRHKLWPLQNGMFSIMEIGKI